MIRSSLADGWKALSRRKGLAALLYALDLAFAFVLSLAVLALLNDGVAQTGFARELARSFDLALWADMGDTVGDVFGALISQLIWVIPLWLVWKAVAQTGLVHALRGDAIRPFWDGVGRYGGRAIVLALCYLGLLVGAVLVVVVAGFVLNGVWQGEVGAFWVNLVILPTLAITLVAILDLMHDYSRIALVVDEQPVRKALATGLLWPFRHGAASRLYVLWFVPALLLWALPVVLDMSVPGGTTAGVWGLFLVQQLALVARAAVTVGWLGSETALYETVRMREAPLFAEEEAYDPPAGPEGGWAVA